ncbi:hypothetical protein BGX26_002161 [Mortierella sp. AD094]|nr:hypothetical protein BGX26_002161 [Mortierella sp. AD094]
MVAINKIVSLTATLLVAGLATVAAQTPLKDECEQVLEGLNTNVFPAYEYEKHLVPNPEETDFGKAVSSMRACFRDFEEGGAPCGASQLECLKQINGRFIDALPDQVARKFLLANRNLFADPLSYISRVFYSPFKAFVPVEPSSTSMAQILHLDSLPVLPEPWDPLTLFQRWIIRCRVAGVEESGLEFGESRYHVEALESKLASLNKMAMSEQNQILQCQISSELGQYYCWNGQYEQAIKFHSQCQDVHRQHTSATTTESHSKCHLDVEHTVALLKLSKLAIGESLEDPKENLLNRLKALERDQQHWELAEEFLKDNITRNLPYTWRQSVLRTVLDRSDHAYGAFIATANALYDLKDPSEMMLEIPSPVMQYLRTVTFESGHEPDAYLSPSIFEDLMDFISRARASYDSCVELSETHKAENKDKVREFTKKLCSSVRHVLCYDAAWRIGLLEPTADDWSLVWDMYSATLARDIPMVAEFMDKASQPAQIIEAEAKALILERMDPDDLEQHIRNQNLPPLTSSLMMMALGAHACNRSQYLDGDYFFQSAAAFMAQEQDNTTPIFGQIDFQCAKHSTWAQLGVLVLEHDQRREKRLFTRLEQRLKVKDNDSAIAKTNNTDMQTTATATATDDNSNAMDVDDNTAEMEALQERTRKEAYASEDESRTLEICRLLNFYLANYGALELNLQLRCLAICINGKQWDFVSNYGRAAAEALDKSVHGEICQVYNVLVPLCAVLGMSQALGVDLKDISTSSCLDSLFSKDLDPINITRVAAFDMIQGLLPSLNRPILNTKGGGSQPSNQSGKRNRKSIHEDAGPTMEEDIGHAAILKMFGWIRLRGVIDVFGALLAGAISSVLPEGAKLTLSEFGYYALFTTSMDSVSSWTDPRVKIIAMLSNGDAGKALDTVPGARQRFAKLLIQVYERQLQFESDTLTKRMGAETSILATQRFDSERGLTVTKATSPVLPSSSSKASINITRYALCLTDLYHLEGMHQDALASFLNACMVSSRCFSDLELLDRRVWSAYTHGPLATAPTAQSPSVSQANAVASSHYSMIPSTFGAPGEPQGQQFYPTLSALSGMNGQNPFPTGQVGLGLSPSSPPEAGGAMAPPPQGPMYPPPPGSTGLLTVPPLPPGPPMPGMSPNPHAGGAPPPPPQAPPLQPAVPSSFALRAIESCMQLNEPLAGVALQQFLPRIDYNQSFTTIRMAHEQGMLSFSAKSSTSQSSLGASITTPISANVNANILSGIASTPPTGPGSMGGANGVVFLPGVANGGLAIAAHILSGSAPGTSTLATILSPRVQSSTSVFTPDPSSITDSVTWKGGAGSNNASGPGGAAAAAAATAAATAAFNARWGGGSLSPQVFLDLVFDLSFLELVSHLCKESKDVQGQLKIQAKINSNRMALDARQPFRDQVHHLAQQDLLTRLWSRYARVG